MNKLVFRISTVSVFTLITSAISVVGSAGGNAKSCHQCGREKHVKMVCRLMKTCEEAELPSYVYTKEEVFYPDKGAVCYTGFRSDTFYDFWRSCDCSKEGHASQQSEKYFPTQLNCSSYTVCGCRTLYGAKSTGCHSGCSIRVPGKPRRITTPILKWETVPLCKDCCDGKK